MKRRAALAVAAPQLVTLVEAASRIGRGAGREDGGKPAAPAPPPPPVPGA